MNKEQTNERIEAIKDSCFGIEIEMTGISRTKAATVLSRFFGNPIVQGYHLDERNVKDAIGRKWLICSDSSIRAEKKYNGGRMVASELYKVELISPVLTYREDMLTLQEVIRALRKAGAIANDTCGIHVHLDGAKHTAQTLRNFVNLVASKDDLLYDALQVPIRRRTYCRLMNEALVRTLKRKSPKTIEGFKTIWYKVLQGSQYSHYDQTRYYMLNLHSLFCSDSNGSLELRCFNTDDGNGKLHAGVIRSYVVLSLAINQQALNQKCASARPNQTENKRFAMRTWLNRMGLIGDEFASCREHLTKHLDGNAAWRFRQAA